MQDVLGRDGFATDAAFGKGQVFGNGGVEVVAHHEHVEVLVNGVDREGARGIGGGGAGGMGATGSGLGTGGAGGMDLSAMMNMMSGGGSIIKI